MSISSVGGASAFSAFYSNAASLAATAAASVKNTAAASPADSQGSTIVTLSNGQTSQVSEGNVADLVATPLALAWAPQAFVAGDVNRNQSLSASEFADQLKRVGVSSETAQKLFNRFDTSKDGTLSIDEFVKGIRTNFASGDPLFTNLINSYTQDAYGNSDAAATNSFLAQGLSAANQYAAVSGQGR